MDQRANLKFIAMYDLRAKGNVCLSFRMPLSKGVSQDVVCSRTCGYGYDDKWRYAASTHLHKPTITGLQRLLLFLPLLQS